MVIPKSDPRLESLLQRLRDRGYKMTTPRRAVITELLVGGTRHRSAEDLTGAVQRHHPDVDLSTVYRTLGLLEEIGIIQHTHLGHGPSIYHLGEIHQHLCCLKCGAITDVPLAALDDLTNHLRQHYDFELHAGHFALTGECAKHGRSKRQD